MRPPGDAGRDGVKPPAGAAAACCDFIDSSSLCEGEDCATRMDMACARNSSI